MTTNVLIVAHRGASKEAPENTMASIKKAVELGADAVEVDVRKTLDGKLVCIHDSTVSRTTNGAGHVSQMTLAQLKTLDAGSWFSKAFAGEKILTTEEVLDYCEGKCLVMLEIKDNCVDELLALLKKYSSKKWILVSSFSTRLLREFKVKSKIRAAKITTVNFFAAWKGTYFHFDALVAFWVLINPKFVATAHKHKLKVFAWTVNNRRLLRNVLKCGVDGVVTDDVAAVREIVG